MSQKLKKNELKDCKGGQIIAVTDGKDIQEYGVDYDCHCNTCLHNWQTRSVVPTICKECCSSDIVVKKKQY